MINNQIPAFLWPEIFKTILRIVNIMSTSILDDRITLYQAFIDQIDPNNKNSRPYILSVKYLYILGTKVYILIQEEHQVKSTKIEPCVEVGILVDYKRKHIYHIYVLSRTGKKIVYILHYRFDKEGYVTEHNDLYEEPNFDINQEPQSKGENP